MPRTEAESAIILQRLVQSDAYREVILPRLERRKLMLQRALRNPAIARKAELPDDYIRGCLETIEWLIDWPEQYSTSVIASMTEDRLVAQQEERYDVIAREGWLAESD